MRTRFPRGSTVYAKDGRSYIVEEVADGIVYCVTSSGAEAEFPEGALTSEDERKVQTKAGPRHEISYDRIKQSRHFLPAGEKLDAAASDQMLTKADRLSPGLIDFAAFTVAMRVLAEHNEEDLGDFLSVKKSRAVFDAAPAAIRARLLAEILGARPDALVSAARLGDNLIKAMIVKGLETQQDAYEDFQDRPRR